ncbi:MAG: stress response translation initiation inhibitor YciH [Candidatus Woesearchaeota archaeon]
MDDELFDKFGLPKELNIGDTIAKEDQRIEVYIIKKKFGKKNTLIEGLDTKSLDMKDITKKLKAKFACGGTCKDGIIELQGDHTQQIKKTMESLGFQPESIDIKGMKR